jgi:multicomponent Na+:H+ antiporter subunit C
MATVLAFLVGGLFAAGVYMLLRRSMVKLIIGLVLISQASNLLIFSAAGLVRDRAPIVPADGSAPPVTADPLPQALVLTAIVISFGVLAFAMVLVQRTHLAVGTSDVDALKGSDT